MSYKLALIGKFKTQSAYKREPRTANLPPIPNRKCASDMDDQRIRETHLFNQYARDACKMSFVLRAINYELLSMKYLKLAKVHKTTLDLFPTHVQILVFRY